MLAVVKDDRVLTNTEARRPLSLTAIVLQGVRNLAAKVQFSRQTQEEKDEYNRTQGYDRLKYDDGKYALHQRKR
jgi:hypothetical protein